MTPLRKQYLHIKQRYPDALLFFRLGDFYETFDDDARLVSRELEIVLTSREMGRGVRVPMAGVPAQAVEGYLARLLKKGYKVAICEQLTDPASSQGLVERDVVRVVTPGTVTEPALLVQKANNYLAAVLVEGEEAGLAYVDISTSEFATAQIPLHQLPLEMARLGPAEVVVPEGQSSSPVPGPALVTPLPAQGFHPVAARQLLLEHFGVVTLEPFGCEALPLATRAAGAVLHYLHQTQRSALEQLSTLRTYSTRSFMSLDPQTRRNLELFHGGRWDNPTLSLFSVLDLTHTPMGGRLLRRWLGQPLLDLPALHQRQDAVEFFHCSALRRERALAALKEVADLERVLNRVRSGTALPRELQALRRSLEIVPQLAALLEEQEPDLEVAWLRRDLHPCRETVELIERAILPDPAGEPGQGEVIREGFSPELDELRQASRNAREFVAGLERTERQRTGIKSLKVGYNKVFGYYIEVTNPHLGQVPTDYIRRQTLVGAERFITPELKEYEARILNARERIEELERLLYRQVCRQVGEQGEAIAALAEAVAQIDLFVALAEAASRYGYVRPTLNEGEEVRIVAGRHPVVERALPPGTFVPNDTSLFNSQDQIIILTGPNMSGKSTYIRQVALIVLMAQMGSFVPADSATIGLVDRIFTRVGLQDDLATGQSTFMVEMVESAAILHQATPRSLVILDEIGRGTSTYDGLSIARAVAEYLHNSPRLGCKTLFATHYHELTDLARLLPRVRNYSVAVAEENGRVVFLHRIIPGGADKSYGVHVAQLAGLPPSVINRAWEVLRGLEADSRGIRPGGRRRARRRDDTGMQMSLLGVPPAVVEELLRLDITNMTPVEAISKLYELQQRAREGRGG
ncbi:MAG: DNA mismatch repair protein MutS [Dehalococcoidia bacterium]